MLRDTCLSQRSPCRNLEGTATKTKCKASGFPIKNVGNDPRGKAGSAVVVTSAKTIDRIGVSHDSVKKKRLAFGALAPKRDAWRLIPDAMELE